ncbi:unnamed protein product [Somion occarium]|uniref:C2H2-type domain-containing protein n=1 Tax=Somion occarium TaxID=3059160 RepID=A0ABP1DEG4_9APHY
MDPSQYYNQGQGQQTNSLSSTTDPSQYPYSQSQVNPDYQQMYPGYPSYGQGSQPVSTSASFPGAMSRNAVPQQMTASRSASVPGNPTYSGYGQMPQGQYTQYQQQPVYTNPQYNAMSPQQSHPPHPAAQYLPSSSQLAQAYPHGHATSSAPIPSPSPGIERYPCDRCSKTFTRAHDRKRHFDTHHAANPPSHKCHFCRKEFARADSLKRHIDNGCEKDPSNVNV